MHRVRGNRQSALSAIAEARKLVDKYGFEPGSMALPLVPNPQLDSDLQSMLNKLK